jgi:hypothetical protein
MEPIRIIHRPKDCFVTFQLPKPLIDQERIEIIVMPYKEKVKSKKKFDPREFKGAANLNMSIDEVDDECKKMRAEWNRDF